MLLNSSCIEWRAASLGLRSVLSDACDMYCLLLLSSQLNYQKQMAEQEALLEADPFDVEAQKK
jgi:hypothetical protein